MKLYDDQCPFCTMNLRAIRDAKDRKESLKRESMIDAVVLNVAAVLVIVVVTLYVSYVVQSHRMPDLKGITMPDDPTVGEILAKKFNNESVSADELAMVKAAAAKRVDAYLSKQYDKIALGRQAPPGIMYKSGAASLLAMFKSGRASKCRDDE